MMNNLLYILNALQALQALEKALNRAFTESDCSIRIVLAVRLKNICENVKGQITYSNFKHTLT